MTPTISAGPASVPALDSFLQPQTWRELNPNLNVFNTAALQKMEVLGIDEPTGNFLDQLMVTEGYFHVPQIPWGLPIEEMANGIIRLSQRGLVPPFCYMYDEYWALFYKLDRLLKRLLGDGYLMLPDFWAWYVDPRAGQSGWRPHRDKTYLSLMPDRRPKSLTIWVPLTEATTLNGCMYIVPADRDPTYGTERDVKWEFAYQDVRALPSPAGGLFCWNQAVLHWGSRSTPRASGPRISLAFEFQRGDVPPFNQPLIKPLSILNVEERLKMICKQILQYQHMYPLSPDLKQFAEAGLRIGMQQG